MGCAMLTRLAAPGFWPGAHGGPAGPAWRGGGLPGARQARWAGRL